MTTPDWQLSDSSFQRMKAVLNPQPTLSLREKMLDNIRTMQRILKLGSSLEKSVKLLVDTAKSIDPTVKNRDDALKLAEKLRNQNVK